MRVQWANMKQRILFGGLMIAALVGLLALDWRLETAGAWPLVGLPVGALVGLLILVGALELARLIRLANLPVMTGAAALMAVSLATGPLWMQLVPANPLHLWRLALPAIVVVAFAVQICRWRLDSPIPRLATTLLVAAYLGGCGACILALRISMGMPALVTFLVAVKVTDIGAYFTGSAWGRHKLIPWLSPGKSWEGLAGGLAAGVLAALVIWWALPHAGHTIIDGWRMGLFALALGLAGQFGDLCESLLKRAASAKDAGRLVPQFGGVLDMIDSPLIAAPVALALWPLVGL
jgi:phosphatidate cytidylyltransferase